jgi:hypothetical protein
MEKKSKRTVERNQFLSYTRLAAILKNAAKKAGVDKRIYCHLTRHSRATELAPHMTEASMCKYFGWGHGSRMPGRYIHMSGKETDEIILQENGIFQEKKIIEPALKPIKCYKCKTINEATNRYCKLCGQPLNEEEVKKVIQADIQRTKADEILRKKDKSIVEVKPEKQYEKEINISIDDERGIFLKRKLSREDIIYLESKGYKEFETRSLKTNKPERYMVFARQNESLPHAFMCYQLFYFIKKFTNKAYMYQTVKPDIVFEVNGKKFAIEVETGLSLSHHKNLLDKKIENLNRTYKDNWFFVVTDRKIA